MRSASFQNLFLVANCGDVLYEYCFSAEDFYSEEAFRARIEKAKRNEPLINQPPADTDSSANELSDGGFRSYRDAAARAVHASNAGSQHAAVGNEAMPVTPPPPPYGSQGDNAAHKRVRFRRKGDLC